MRGLFIRFDHIAGIEQRVRVRPRRRLRPRNDPRQCGFASTTARLPKTLTSAGKLRPRPGVAAFANTPVAIADEGRPADRFLATYPIRRCWLPGAGRFDGAAGLVAGILCTLAWDAAFFSGRVDTRFADPKVLVPVALVLTLVTITACAVPVRRATRLNPVVALRQE
jgi:hypothetical protein